MYNLRVGFTLIMTFTFSSSVFANCVEEARLYVSNIESDKGIISLKIKQNLINCLSVKGNVKIPVTTENMWGIKNVKTPVTIKSMWDIKVDSGIKVSGGLYPYLCLNNSNCVKPLVITSGNPLYNETQKYLENNSAGKLDSDYILIKQPDYSSFFENKNKGSDYIFNGSSPKIK